MKLSKTICLLTLCATVLLMFIEIGFAPQDSAAASLLPPGLVFETEYKPGFGEPVGKVLVVRGEVIIIHADEQVGYLAAKDLPLYKNDTVVTRSQSRARLMLNDGSLLTLAPRTKLVISRSVYEPKKKSRSTYIEQEGGKVRYWIKKLLGHTPSECKVKTPTAVAGVRGSDFIISVTATHTEVTALDHTELEVVSLAAPDMIPIRVVDFERTIIQAGALPSDVRRAAPEEIARLMQDVRIAPDGMEPEAEINPDAGAAQTLAAGEDGIRNERDTAGADEMAAASSKRRQNESQDDATGEAVSEADGSESNVEGPLVLVPETELVMPEALTDIPELEDQIPAPITEPGIIESQEQAVIDQQEAIMEQVQEELVELNRILPDFPGTP